MTADWIPLGLAAALFAMAFFYVIGQFNGFVALRNHAAEAWSNIDTELKRRHDLIPNLVVTVRGYAAHESAVLEEVVRLRTARMANSGPVAGQIDDENRLAAAVQQLLAVVEGYPDLRADRGFLALQQELVNTEDRIQAARRFYNGNIRDYRNKYEGFPTNLIARLFGLGPLEFLAIEPAVRTNPAVGG